MFRRKKPGLEQFKAPPAPPEVERSGEPDPQPLKPLATPGTNMNSKPHSPPARPDIPRRVMEIPAPARRPAGGEVECKKLIVGRDISLSGAITACDKLVVEGTVEANLSEAGTIEIAETGLFKGNADVDEAEIGGRFEGGLTVRRKLTIRASGRVEGTIRYSRIIIESGGVISGTVELLPEGEGEEPARGPRARLSDQRQA